MEKFRRERTVGQMAAAVCAFVVCAALLESGGLYQWAQRLELGPVRTVAVPVTGGVHRLLAPLRIEALRVKMIAALGRSGWSDDPAEQGTGHVATAVSEAVPVAVATPVIETPIVLRRVEGDPPLRTELPEFADAGKPLTVALAGDSMMAVGLSSTILRDAPKFPTLTFVKAFKSGTGLARPEVFDWQKEYPAMLGEAKPDVVIVAIGANDGQGFVDDGVTYPFGSEGWKRIYQERVVRYLRTLQADGAQVVWLGLPPMKSEAYDEHIRLVNRIDYAVVKATPGVTWFSTAGLIGEDGQFRDFGEVKGKTVRLRQGDGIHFSDEGATVVVDVVLPWLAGR